MQNPNTKTSMECLAQLTERAKKYTNLEEEDRVRILNSYAFYLLSKNFSGSFDKLAKGFAIFATILGLRHLDIVEKVAKNLEKQKQERNKKKVNKRHAHN